MQSACEIMGNFLIHACHESGFLSTVFVILKKQPTDNTVNSFETDLAKNT